MPLKIYVPEDFLPCRLSTLKETLCQRCKVEKKTVEKRQRVDLAFGPKVSRPSLGVLPSCPPPPCPDPRRPACLSPRWKPHCQSTTTTRQTPKRRRRRNKTETSTPSRGLFPLPASWASPPDTSSPEPRPVLLLLLPVSPCIPLRVRPRAWQPQPLPPPPPPRPWHHLPASWRLTSSSFTRPRRVRECNNDVH